jgi:hypothetical protein
MKGVAMLVAYFGFVAVAWGANKLNNGCVTWKQTAWPQGSPIVDPCSTAGSPAPTQPAPPNAGTSQAPGTTTAGGRGTSSTSSNNYSQFLAQRIPNPAAS